MSQVRDFGRPPRDCPPELGRWLSEVLERVDTAIDAAANRTAGRTFALVSGGVQNRASGMGSVVPGGIGAVADMHGQLARAAGYFSAVGDAQVSEFILRRTTTDNVASEMFLDGATGTGRMVLPNDTTWAFQGLIAARRTDANGESAAYKFEGAIDRNASAGTTALVAAVTPTAIVEDTAAWDVAISADATNGSLKIAVTGENSKTIRWVGHVLAVQVTG